MSPRFSFSSLYGAYPRQFWVLWLGTLINRLGEFVVPLLGFYLSAQQHFSVTQITLVLALLGVGRFVSEPLGGWLSDFSGAGRMWTYMLAGLLFSTTYQSYKMLAVVFAQQGFSAAQYGQVLAVNGALVVVLGLPLGHWIARHNHPRWQAVSALLLGAGFGLHALAHSLGMHTLAVVIWSLGEIAGYSIGKTIIAELGRAEVRGRYIGLLGSMSGLGTLLSPLMGGWLLSRWGNTPLWLTFAALSGLAALIYWRLERAVLARRAQLVQEASRAEHAGADLASGHQA